MAELTMHEHEQRAILENPEGVMLLMNWHDYQQTCAEAMDMDCQGNRRRYEELKAHGRAIVLKDPEIWSDEVLRAFGVTRGVPASQASSVDDLMELARQYAHAYFNHHTTGFSTDGMLAKTREALRDALTLGVGGPFNDQGEKV